MTWRALAQGAVSPSFGKPANNRMQATAGGDGGGITCDGRAPAAAKRERRADNSLRGQT